MAAYRKADTREKEKEEMNKCWICDKIIWLWQEIFNGYTDSGPTHARCDCKEFYRISEKLYFNGLITKE